MNLDNLQHSLNAYLTSDDSGNYLLPSPVKLKPYGESGALADTKILDHNDECLQLFVSGGNGKYIISDHGYISREIRHLGDDSYLHLLVYDTEELTAELLAPFQLTEANGQIICSASDENFAENLTIFIRLLWHLAERIRKHLNPRDYQSEDKPDDENRSQRHYVNDSEEILYSIQFCYQGQALTGTDLIARIPQSPALRKAYERFCGLRTEALLEGMTEREASRRAQAILDAEIAAQLD